MKQTTVKLRRILVALDSALNTSRSLESGVELAARFQADLFGLFVEDADILRAAALPFTHQVNLLTGSTERLDTTAAERQLSSTANVARRRLAAAATERQVRWSFTRVRGSVVNELTTAATDADLLVIQGSTAPFDRYLRGRPRSGGALLVVPPGTQLGQPVAVCFDGSDTAVDALRVATKLCGGDGGALELFLGAETDAHCRLLEEQARRELEGLAIDIVPCRLIPAGVEGLRRTLRRRKEGCLVVCSSWLPEEVDVQALAAQFGTPVLMLR